MAKAKTKSQQDWKTGLSYIVLTFRRPDGIETALKSLMTQSLSGIPIEVVVADNDPEASAKDFVEAFAKTAPLEIVYLHVPSPGVSNARNAALAKARGRYIAWLDDDQDATPKWAETLYKASRKYKAGLTFSPTRARIPGTSKYNDYLERFFERKGPGIDAGVIDHFYGCGNSLMDLSLCELPSPAFDVAANETGGEDDLLFSYIQNRGAKIAWTEDAIAYEDIRPHRATPEYVRTRSFAFGQGPTELAADDKNIIGIIKWMCVGVAQMAIFGPMALMTRIIGHKSYIHFLAKTAQGAGKVFWFGQFKPKLYGAAVASNTVH